MKRVVLICCTYFLLLSLCVAAEVGEGISAEQILLKAGFSKVIDPQDAGWLIERCKIGEIMKKLGLKISDLKPTLSQPGCSDIRMTETESFYFFFESLRKDKKGYVISGSLNKSDCPCTVKAIIRKTKSGK